MTREQFRPGDHPTDHFLLTSVVGSYPQPPWLAELRTRHEDGEVETETYECAADDACRIAITEQERGGLDVVTDGEQRRDDMVSHFTRFIDGYDDDAGGGGWNQRMPTVTDTVSSAVPWLVEDFEFADRFAERPVKTTVTGPFTLASFASLDAYDDVPTLAYDFADLVAEEAARLAEAGARWIQVDEPALGMSPVDEVAHECLTRISAAVPDDVRLGVHVCSGNYENLAPEMFSFPVDELDLEFASDDADAVDAVFGEVSLEVDVGLGVVDSQTASVESVETVRENIEAGLAYIPPDRLTLTPDCGLKPLPREVARGKVEVLAEAARAVEADLDAGRIDRVASGAD